MTDTPEDSRFVRLAAADNILVATTTLAAGDTLTVGGQAVTLAAPLSLGHKIAAGPIRAGETVTKYNFPIGVATEDIPTGAHVHVHNMRSDYTPTYVIPEA